MLLIYLLKGEKDVKQFSNLLNSDMMNKLIDKKLTTFSLFLVKEEKGYSLYFNDKTNGTEILIAKFKSYNQYLRWLIEACILRVGAPDSAVKVARQIYKKLYAFSRDDSRKNPVEEI